MSEHVQRYPCCGINLRAGDYVQKKERVIGRQWDGCSEQVSTFLASDVIEQHVIRRKRNNSI